MSEYESTMLKLAQMTATQIAKKQKKSRLKAFLKFMKSETGIMLFDASTDMWMNGPDYLEGEYHREMNYKRHRRTRNG